MSQKVKIGISEKWWLLRHPHPKAIDQQLRVLNDARVTSGDAELVYLIPHLFTRESEPNKTLGDDYEAEAEKNNNMRSAMRQYLFIKCKEDEIRQLVASDWNRGLTTHLLLCRNRNGDPLWASTKDMDSLVALMMKYQQLFNIVPSEVGFQKDSVLRVKLEMFRGYDFHVKKFSGAGQGAKLVLELPLSNGNFTLRTQSMFVSEEYLPMEIKQLLTPASILKMERGLVATAVHRMKGRKSLDEDAVNLNNFHYLNYMELTDSPEHRHLRVLLLLCAALRKDKRTMESLIPVVQRMLGNPAQAATDDEAFAMAVLFIATRNADWRTAAKQYQQTHDTLSESLSLLMPIIKNIHLRNNKTRIGKRLEAKMTKRVNETLSQIRDCRIDSLSPQAACAVWDILALPAYDTDEGHAVRDAFRKKFDDYLRPWQSASDYLCSTPPPQDVESSQDSAPTQALPPSQDMAPTQDSFQKSRSRLLHLVSPSVDFLVSYYQSLVRLYPDRTTADATDLYEEFHGILLQSYKKVTPLTPSWWRLKAILEHYHR